MQVKQQVRNSTITIALCIDTGALSIDNKPDLPCSHLVIWQHQVFQTLDREDLLGKLGQGGFIRNGIYPCYQCCRHFAKQQGKQAQQHLLFTFGASFGPQAFTLGHLDIG